MNMKQSFSNITKNLEIGFDKTKLENYSIRQLTNKKYFYGKTRAVDIYK